MIKTPNKKKILIFSTAYIPFLGGAEVSIREITDRITDYEFELITAQLDPSLPKKERIGNVVVHRIGTGGRLDKFLLPWRGARYVARLTKLRPPDLFWGVMATYASGIPYLLNILRRKKIPIVLTLQEGDSEEHIARRHLGLISLSWRLALARTDFLTVLSNYLKERAIHFGYRGPLEVIPLGVDIGRFGKALPKAEVEALEKRFQKKEGERYIITASRLVEKNGVSDLVRSLLYLPDTVKLLIAGDGELGESLWKLTQELSLEKRVKFLGAYTHDELVRYLAISDVFVRPSLSEGQGVAFQEAMAAGVPIIGTPVGGIPDFLRDDSSPLGQVVPTGLFCEVGNPESIATKVKRLCEDDQLRERIVLGAKTLVGQEYDWIKISEAMRKKVFEEMLK